MRAVIKKDGTLVAVYSDFIRDINLGPLRIERASDVLFNETDQMWEARWPNGSLICQHSLRGVVLAIEKEAVENQLLA